MQLDESCRPLAGRTPNLRIIIVPSDRDVTSHIEQARALEVDPSTDTAADQIPAATGRHLSRDFARVTGMTPEQFCAL